MKRDEIVQYLKDNPGWVLQYQHGIHGKGWWWLRNTQESTKTINIQNRSAIAARALLKHLPAKQFGETNYGLP